MESMRNKLGWGLSGALALLLLAALAGVVHGGPLDPTAPPGSTGKNVITSLPFTISQPGSYVLNSNLTGVGGQSGITVNANNVTIDLQGFELVGVPGASSGIVDTASFGLTVKHGTIRNWPSLAIADANRNDSVVDDVRVLQNGWGMVFGSRAAISNCIVQGSTSGWGITAGDQVSVTNCLIEANANIGISLGNNSTITDTVVKNSGSTEILTSGRATLENCVADGAGSAGNGLDVGAGSTVRGCTASNNGGFEIQAGASTVLQDCVADGNGSAGYGIYVAESSTVSNCTARNNGDTEIYALDRVLIENCVADGWTGSARSAGHGVLIGTASVVRGCSIENNAGTGILVGGANNRIEGNHVRANSTYGISAGGTGDVVVQNDSKLNGSGTLAENCNDAGADFVKATSPAGAGAFDNICD